MKTHATMDPELWAQMPWDLTVIDMICYEACNQPIILKNGAEMHPEGWLRFFKLTPEDVLGEGRDIFNTSDRN